ncbi:acyl-CoA dehydrogenase family protein [Formosa algae]|uniref:Alkylation response protein AidB-like acyl-CoA dehydrogenase n=1 Tax=Formosa algae TaxID=225843 RepID=A0A9X0YN68_9FLAO|nr:acyl-CoA dehydrogenase family protein [Formosa algae]MBP1841646.1 alkylation response protein AidB-like acyl-CoA dehydrogenase [Formosa algae]MDQ0337153.1 alkylation response protein AidB-like acyl-CoA dehydrogenase [Formosa algae]OEI80630.1 acyl-CoA dehydrogenase [Formosa algae]
MLKDFSEYIKDFENTLKDVFHQRYDIHQFSKERGLPVVVLRDIMAKAPLSVAIPENYGGRGVKVNECLRMLSAASYESLPLSLTFGINIALFLEPVAKYANESVKGTIFKRFLEKQNMGGLMITEPDFGSDALGMQTYNEKVEDGYTIKGTKHWQGLTGMADYWLITSRGKSANGNLNRDIDFFICDVSQPNQQITVEEYYDNLGLYMIPYGKNKVDVQVPENYKLEPHSSGVKMMLDVLHRSRMQFPGMALGFIKRMLDESIKYCTERVVGQKKLIELDQVKYQISTIQSSYTIASAMCYRSSTHSGIDHDLANSGIEANTMKAFVTDLMQDAAQTLTQLSGSKGFKMENIGGRGIMDSRAFQIFEGSNEMLYTQITEMIFKLMKRKKEFNIYRFLKEFNLTTQSYAYFKDYIDFSVDIDMKQRKMIDLGKVFSRIISINFVLDMQDKGFRTDLITNCVELLKLDVSNLINSFHSKNTVIQIEDYNENSQWYNFI